MECLDKDLVKGKIVLCDWPDGINSAFSAGALGCIAKNYNDQLTDVSDVVPLPASILNLADYTTVLSYLNSTKYVLLRIPFCLISLSFMSNSNSGGGKTFFPEYYFGSLSFLPQIFSYFFAEILEQRY